MSKYTIVTGHGRIEFIKKGDKFHLVAVDGKPLPKPVQKIDGKLGKRKETDEVSNISK